MKRNTYTLRNTHGYAILFTVVIVGLISLIAMGLSSTAYKQVIISSAARDSQSAFYESEIVSECVLYADNQTDTFSGTSTTTSLSCGLKPSGSNYVLDITKAVVGSVTTYTLSPTGSDGTSPDPCFRATVKKDATVPTIVSTELKVKGYNICNLSNIRTVEREIDINY
jgi:Tfp pilus assembly protein PilE